jgi:NRPS condensation-like uncharacterized protein
MENKKLKAQAFDCMQYFYGAVQAPCIRCLIQLGDCIEEALLEKAVLLSLGAVPQIGCVFDKAAHVWRKRDYSGKDIVHLVTVPPSIEDPSTELLLTELDSTIQPQLKIFIVRKDERDTLCFIINHMICDGAGLKEYLYLLSDLYTNCEKGTAERKLSWGKRNLNQLLKNFSISVMLGILRSKPVSGKQDKQLLLPLCGDAHNPLLVTKQLEESQFRAICNSAKEHGASVNDVFLTAYLRGLCRWTGCRTITVPCPVDLRKYKLDGQRSGICNLTSNYVCSVELPTGEAFAETLQKVAKQMNAQKNSNACLKGPMLLHALYYLIPFRLLQTLFLKLSPVPVTSYTNLGVLDEHLLRFGVHPIEHAFMSTALKKAPYYQLSVSTYRGCCTLSSSLYGLGEDEKTIKSFFNQMTAELETFSGGDEGHS